MFYLPFFAPRILYPSDVSCFMGIKRQYGKIFQLNRFQVCTFITFRQITRCFHDFFFKFNAVCLENHFTALGIKKTWTWMRVILRVTCWLSDMTQTPFQIVWWFGFWLYISRVCSLTWVFRVFESTDFWTSECSDWLLTLSCFSLFWFPIKNYARNFKCRWLAVGAKNQV